MAAGTWLEAINDKAEDETVAHMSKGFPLLPILLLFQLSLLKLPCWTDRLAKTQFIAMFDEKENPGYPALVKNAADLVVGWAKNEW